jgi:hypothetical protein
MHCFCCFYGSATVMAGGRLNHGGHSITIKFRRVILFCFVQTHFKGSADLDAEDGELTFHQFVEAFLAS